MAGAAALAAETCKYHVTPMGQNVRCWGGLVPLRVETFGKWGKEAQGVFTRLASHLQAGVSGEVTVISQAAGLPLSQSATRMRLP